MLVARGGDERATLDLVERKFELGDAIRLRTPRFNHGKKRMTKWIEYRTFADGGGGSTDRV